MLLVVLAATTILNPSQDCILLHLDKNGKLRVPTQSFWPRFQGLAPIEPPSDSQIGYLRTWIYSFEGNWDRVLAAANAELPKAGFKVKGGGKLVEFYRIENSDVSVSFDHDSYTLYKDSRMKPGDSDLRDAVGWITVARGEPNGGPYLSRN